MSKDRTLCEYNEKESDVIEHLENWVKGRYRKECGSRCLGDSSIDGFSKGYKCATCMAAFEVGKILGMDLSALRSDNV